MELTVLGSGTVAPSAGRTAPAHWVSAASVRLLLLALWSLVAAPVALLAELAILVRPETAAQLGPALLTPFARGVCLILGIRLRAEGAPPPPGSFVAPNHWRRGHAPRQFTGQIWLEDVVHAHLPWAGVEPRQGAPQRFTRSWLERIEPLRWPGRSGP